MMKKYKTKFFQEQRIQNKVKSINKNNVGKLQKWIDGKTGVDFIGASMIELKLTGFMSNRGLQNVASYFCNDLKLDWRYGACYFEEQLLDYDGWSNRGKWAYQAGVGNGSQRQLQF